tara:strand:+ start:365 stop:508 length:144 start_codon:yes stop_codon:yes gene_type:complete
MSMRGGKFDRHETAVERKLDRIIQLLEAHLKILTAFSVAEMMTEEEE